MIIIEEEELEKYKKIFERAWRRRHDYLLDEKEIHILHKIKNKPRLMWGYRKTLEIIEHRFGDINANNNMPEMRRHGRDFNKHKL